ncbi:hypothetical protein M2M59_12025 [Rummeliibacillus sp. G93]|uniref:hypothetical protein n=1 Tax=Rummeliibacillus sp. G93 TaxID=2939494 RepID=UPI00201C8F93|nr:hypothetical protein [Rummeliibacillus sp. G93]UQW96688.1 hypothetical protein M2M59_12025 [Rummeliibacillus sp. G93]
METYFFVCHGKTEKLFIEYIASTYRIPLTVLSKKNGKSSIQINMLKSYLKGEINKGTLTQSKLEEYSKVYVLILMDIDELYPMSDGSDLLHLKNPYISGELLNLNEDLILNSKIEYLTFHNDLNMEDVLKKTDLQVPNSKTDIQKIFPLSNTSIKIDGIETVKNEFAKLDDSITTVDKLIEFLQSKRVQF